VAAYKGHVEGNASLELCLLFGARIRLNFVKSGKLQQYWGHVGSEQVRLYNISSVVLEWRSVASWRQFESNQRGLRSAPRCGIKLKYHVRVQCDATKLATLSLLTSAVNSAIKAQY